MLYTVVPLERIYANPRRYEIEKKEEQNKQKDSAEMEYQDVLLPHGRVVTRRDGENYIVEKIYSTNMTDYLNDEYAPGKTVKR